MSKRIQVTPGDRYGRLTVIEEVEPETGSRGRRFRRVTCRCDCGTLVSARLSNLRSKQVQSCGCVYIQHGHAIRSARTPVYHTWVCMRQRCENPEATGYENYGGCGISVCRRWQESFEVFLEDMGERPNGHTLDRYPDPNGDYEPGNCRWARPRQQMRNMRRNRWLTIDGTTMCLTDWAQYAGVAVQTIIYRLAAGWSIKEALTLSSHARRKVRS